MRKLRTLDLLKSSKLIKNYEIIDFKKGEDFYYLKAKDEIIDGSLLYIKEYISENEYLYSYHWQDTVGKIIVRWDNAPHHKKIKTYPHHTHQNGIKESKIKDFKDILILIKKIIEKGIG